MECTRYTSAREILRNSTFLRHAAKCERAICKQSIASPAENRCNQEQPSITSNGVVLGFFYVAFRGFFEDKIAYVPFVFLCRIDIWAIFIRKTYKPLFCCGHQPTASWELSSIYSAIRRNSSAYLNFTLMFPPS